MNVNIGGFLWHYNYKIIIITIFKLEHKRSG